MLQHFLKVALRRLLTDKAFSFINLIGLAIGISAVFLLSKYLGFHMTADDFHESKKNLFAIHQTLTGEEGKVDFSTSTYHGVGPLAKDQFPEVIGMSRYLTTGEALINAINRKGERRQFNERNVVEVDPDFLQMFTFHFLHGDPQSALDKPGSIVLSESMARKYFGVEDVLGQTLTTKKTWGDKETWTVTGVVEDYPENSIFQFDCLQSLVGKNLAERDQGGWSYPAFRSYILLNKPSHAAALSEKMSSLITGIDEFKAEQERVDFHLAALADETSLTNSQKLMALVGLILLLITWINYTNLSSAKSLTRGKEFGVRRVLGSDRTQLVKQFLYEALLLYVIALVAVATIVVAAYPLLYELSGGQMLPMFEVETPINWMLLLFLLVGAMLSSTYPSFSVSRFSITGLLSSNGASNPESPGFHKFLVVFQFTISVIMLIGIATIYRQMQFINNQEVGFDLEQMLILKSPKDKRDGKWERMRSFKNELGNQPFATSVASSTTVPLWWPGSPTDFRAEGLSEPVRTVLLGADAAYFTCYDLDLVAGQGFKAGQHKANDSRAIVNETATRKLGYASPEQALHQKIRNQKTDEELEIIGVVQDHHHESLRKKIQPQVFQFNPYTGFVSVKLQLKDRAGLEYLASVIESTQSIWHDIYPDQAFDYYFLDERFSDIYRKERLFQSVFLTFTILSVVITFLGIFGLSMFISLRRRKEIGVRKVLGATPLQIFLLFIHEFLRKAGLALLIGTPIAYYILTIWLSNFSYRIAFNIWLLVLPGLALALLTIVSLSFESVKMARVNPIHILKEE